MGLEIGRMSHLAPIKCRTVLMNKNETTTLWLLVSIQQALIPIVWSAGQMGLTRN